MQIEVQQQTSRDLVCVVVEGVCNHYDTQNESMEFTAYSRWEDAHISVPDDSEEIDVEVCQRCGAWRHYGQEGWNDASI